MPTVLSAPPKSGKVMTITSSVCSGKLHVKRKRTRVGPLGTLGSNVSEPCVKRFGSISWWVWNGLAWVAELGFDLVAVATVRAADCAGIESGSLIPAVACMVTDSRMPVGMVSPRTISSVVSVEFQVMLSRWIVETTWSAMIVALNPGCLMWTSKCVYLPALIGMVLLSLFRRHVCSRTSMGMGSLCSS